MNVALLLEKRREQWAELEQLCESMEVRGKTSKSARLHPNHQGATGVARFATLYRSACADLALADAYQLPPSTVSYLHRLVARAHNQLYRVGSFQPTSWLKMFFEEAPQQIFADGCVRVATIVFFGLFALSMYIGAAESTFPGVAEAICGTETLEQTSESFTNSLGVNSMEYAPRAAFYIQHNTSIGLKCFAGGILLIPCIFTLAFNAIVLGSTFGYMSREGIDGADNFFNFVTAHGPLELTAIALSAGAGLRIGMGLFRTRGLTRSESVRESGRRAVPIMTASAVMFILAAFTEGFLSPSAAPYLFKVTWSVVTSGLISFYFVILGFPSQSAASESPIRAVSYDELMDGSEHGPTFNAVDATPPAGFISGGRHAT
ncbi:stage II sporulation protein M [Stieleria varia]|uniref:Stage II sporulation protein M n=1 Tax=Stieleria varia TaxID=2528005 RepID=A0A5C5ZWA4_9BACT|nr:stage II sporulation protein M [Stieleria varia]TWT91297.1 hypothetical protein Pla52n_66310 [Stieleria varia]